MKIQLHLKRTKRENAKVLILSNIMAFLKKMSKKHFSMILQMPKFSTFEKDIDS